MRKFSLVAVSVAALLGVLFFTTRPMAGRVVVDDLEVALLGECSIITVTFNFPVQYKRHFPYASGEDLRVQLDAIVTGAEEAEALYTREAVLLPPGDIGELLDVSYEGNIDGGPYLTLFFRRAVKFSVAQGKDFRSLVVKVSPIKSAAPCKTAPEGTEQDR
ncbi:MAG: hypothetical protein IME99_08695 [Proteobacteria bacterium]|nr:hypothetical protein [Pseudomonadota bacterium]